MQKKKGKNTDRMQFYTTPEMHLKLLLYAKKERQPISSVIKRAIKDLLIKEETYNTLVGQRTEEGKNEEG